MTEEEKAHSEVLNELEALGNQLTTAVKSLWDSEDSRKLRQEIGDGFVELGHQIQTAVRSAQESEAAKQFSEQVREQVDKARESDVTGKIEEGLLTGLRELNAQISKLITSLQGKEAAEAEPEGEAEA